MDEVKSDSDECLQIAGVGSLFRIKLSDWTWSRPFDWLSKIMRDPIIVEHCEGCGRRLLKDGCHRMLLMAIIARRKRAYLHSESSEWVAPNEEELIKILASTSGKSSADMHDVLAEFEIEVTEVASNEWRQHSVSDMLKVCICSQLWGTPMNATWHNRLEWLLQQFFAGNIQGAVHSVDDVLNPGFDQDVWLDALADKLGAVGV